MKVKLILVEVNKNPKKGQASQSNKVYEMEKKGGLIHIGYGRVGNRLTTLTKPLRDWDKIYRSKIRKGYTDISHLKTASTNISSSSNIDFNEFYDIFSKYVTKGVQSNYLVEGCTPLQLKEAQKVLDRIIKLRKKDDINDSLIELFKIIPRKMKRVDDFLLNKLTEKNGIIKYEQDALDSIDSSNISISTDPYKELGLIDFKNIDQKDLKSITDLVNNTMKSSYNIKNIFEVTHNNLSVFDNNLSNLKKNQWEFLIHGTRNPNIFSILKSGLLIRPSNAVSFAGSAYGDGIYHSAHAEKSLGYTGRDTDAIFFIQKVATGKKYTYSGWYRYGKDISRSQMSYSGLSKLGYDSLYVKAGDGLLNSEYIVYKAEQSVTRYLVHLKRK